MWCDLVFTFPVFLRRGVVCCDADGREELDGSLLTIHAGNLILDLRSMCRRDREAGTWRS